MTSTKAEDRWRQVLDEQAASGLTVAEFCRRGKLNTSSFYRWRKMLGKREPSGQFVPVSVVEDPNQPSCDTVVEVAFPGGVVMRVPAGDSRLLGQVVSSLILRGEDSE